ncbi:hypothetical protein ACSLBF_16650 [Pseudoalteromonas sp. T1lg65]|uniref:hypothetical protein n=1 Tax=Pseudoalteromonas sp. T1lg65 TaxID=2077101 RepID=UPI003F797D30
MFDELFLLITLICIYLLPVALVAGSKRTKRHEKNGWLIATLVFSWLALLLYFSMIPKGGRKKRRR